MDMDLNMKKALMQYLKKSTKNYCAWCSVMKLFDTFFITVQEHFVYGYMYVKALSNDISTELT